MTFSRNDIRTRRRYRRRLSLPHPNTEDIMSLKIETFSNLKGGNSFFKAATHPNVAGPALALRRRLEAAKAVALYDPFGFAAGFAALFDLSRVRLAGCFTQNVAAIGQPLLGHDARPVTALPESGADLVFVAGFDVERAQHHIAHLLPAGAEVVSLDAMRLPEAMLSNPRSYLDPLNFATNFVFFREQGGHHTRLVTTNYWSDYGAKAPRLALTLFDGAGTVIAEWQEALGPAGSTVTLDSRAIRARFALPEFEGQLFVHVAGIAGHDVVKYALDTWEDDGPSLSCTHDANAWPADFYAGLPAPRADETVVLWVQNSLPVPIPAGAIQLNLMGDAQRVAFPTEVAPFATAALDVADLLPDARWPQQIEIVAGRHIVRPRYEVTRKDASGVVRRRIAHPNVERTDLKPDPAIAQLGPSMGKGFLLPAPILPVAEWRSIALPTPMATGQEMLPVAAIAYDPEGKELGRHRFGRLARHDSVTLALDEMLAGSAALSGHVELVYDFDAGTEVDGWLHALFRYERRDSGHAAETSFGAHIYNTVLTWRDEPQSYAGRPPGLSTRLFLRLGAAPFDSFCHLVYPASTPWHARSATTLTLMDETGTAVARRDVAIACGGSLFWRYHETFSPAERDRAGSAAYVVIRDLTCRLFGYHGLIGAGGRFSLDHMFGY
jgi:hypothetical protein